jgi:glycosyltransferase involved in cell wall biosynthesis
MRGGEQPAGGEEVAGAVALSVVIPCRNGAETLRELLEALVAQTWDHTWEVVFADNGSTDRSVDVVESFGSRLPRLRVVQADGNGGPAHAMNVGAAAARGRLIAFCDSDDVVGQGWLSALGEALAVSPFVAAVQETTLLNPAWLRSTRDELGQRLPVTRFPPYLPYAGAGTIGIGKQLHEQVGGFDETIGAQFEIDYAFRLAALGIHPVLVPGAVLHYRWRTSVAANFRQGLWYARGRAVVEKRHRSRPPTVYETMRWPVAGWREMARLLVQIRDRGGRTRLAWHLGWQLGRYRASVRHAVLIS